MRYSPRAKVVGGRKKHDKLAATCRCDKAVHVRGVRGGDKCEVPADVPFRVRDALEEVVGVREVVREEPGPDAAAARAASVPEGT